MGLLDMAADKLIDSQTRQAARDMDAKLSGLKLSQDKKLRVMAVFLAEAAKLLGMSREDAAGAIRRHLRALP